MGVAQLPQYRWMVYFMDNPTMNDNWGYHYFRKPSYN